MTLRIEQDTDGETTSLRLVGRIQREHLEELSAQIRAIDARIVIDIGGVNLVDADAVRFLGVIEAQGIELLRCAPYIREWIRRENEEARS
jgi:anti-anti-sigma regulatory factor